METKNLSERSAYEVFENHLKLAQEGKLEEDLKIIMPKILFC